MIACKITCSFSGALQQSSADRFESAIVLHCTSQVPRGHVWLLGDNAPVSYDSRSYGPVPYALITGRVFAQVRLAAGATGDAVCCVLSAFLP